MSAPPVLILRPLPGAERTAATVAALGLRAVVSPLLRYERTALLRAEDVAGARALAFTSAAAVRAAADDVATGAAPETTLDLPAYCVGDATTATARARGFARAVSAAGDSAALQRLLGALDYAEGEIVHLCGEDVAAPLTAGGEGRLRARALYAAHPVRELSDDARAALAHAAIALVHSRRIAERLAELIADAPPAALTALTISARAAEPLNASVCRAVVVAPRATEAALIEALADEVRKTAD